MSKIQIQRSRLAISASPAEIEAMAEAFGQRHAMVFPQLIEPELLVQIQDAVERASFEPRHHHDIGEELCMAYESLALQMLLLLANRPQMLDLIQRITASPQLGQFSGRVYRFPPRPEFFEPWHDDATRGRQIGMSVNLGKEPYEGGEFELRAGETTIFHVANTVPGNALLFRVRPGLQHRVTAMSGAVPKTALAGWFIEKANSQSHLELIRLCADYQCDEDATC